MIIVLATVKVLPDRKADALVWSLTHATRSRSEAGCLSHAVFEDPLQPDHLQFVEEWASEQAFKQHLGVPATADFVNTLIAVAVGRPRFRIFAATEQPFPRLGEAG